jgi:hypothetical protein
VAALPIGHPLLDQAGPLRLSDLNRVQYEGRSL